MPERIQLRRTKGWRKPEGAIVVSRPTRWGNPYRVRQDTTGMWAVVYTDPTAGAFDDLRDACLSMWTSRAEATAEAVRLHRQRLVDTIPETGFPVDPWMQRDIIEHLAGRDLCCWCPLDSPCHADVLLELANGADR